MNHQFKIGGDPRTLLDYAALRDELAKLNHPARPDINWQCVEQLSLSLFGQNGIELQTLSWYTLARIRLAGMAGLNEGLLILEKLFTHHWGAMWPQPVHARIEILTGLNQRLQSMLRTFTFYYADLSQIYQAEQHLNVLQDTLQHLELKNASQIGELASFMRNAATRLENMDMGNSIRTSVVLPPRPAKEIVYFEPLPIAPTPTAGWKNFAAGMLTMMLVGGGLFWGMNKINPSTVVTYCSSLLSQEPLPALWCQNYNGLMLASRSEPVDVDKLQTQWQQYMTNNALSQETLSGWNQGMEGLQELTRRLNALDERKGKYLTGSELKSMVFTITQNFGRTVPVEEQLYQLNQTPNGTPVPAALLLQTDIHLNQLLNRYALIKQQTTTP